MQEGGLLHIACNNPLTSQSFFFIRKQKVQ